MGTKPHPRGQHHQHPAGKRRKWLKPGQLNITSSMVGSGWHHPRSHHHHHAHQQWQTHHHLSPSACKAPSELCLCIMHPCAINSYFLPPSTSLRSIPGLKVRHGSGAGSPPRDKLHLRTGSFSWLVTFQQSNYHCGMRNSLINYYCQAGLCAMIIPSEANFLNIWKQQYSDN